MRHAVQAGGKSKLSVADVRGRVAAVMAIALDRLLEHVRWAGRGMAARLEVL